MENHKDDILKKFLQDTFSDYEPEPSDTSWETIFSAIQPNQPTFWDKSKPWVASVLVILTGVWFWYSSATVEANNSGIVLSSGREINAGRVLNPASVSTNSQILLSSQMQKHGVNDKIENKITKYSKEIIVKSDAPKEEGENHPIVERQSDEAVVSRDNLTASTNGSVETIVSGRVETLATDGITTDMDLLVKTSTNVEMNVGRVLNPAYVSPRPQIKQISTDKIKENQRESVESQYPLRVSSVVYSSSGQAGTITTDVKTVTENSTIEQVRYIRPLESLRNKDFTLTKIALNSPIITPVITPNREAKPVRQHTYLSMSITPIQTYRILTINNNYVQKVQTNNLFDSERTGWAFDLGVIKPIGKLWNFRTNLSYLRMRQWSEYQIGTDELILRNNNSSSSNSNPSQGVSSELEVVGQNVTESKNLHMVGLKIDVQKFFKITAKNRYFISTGTQVMYENSQKQSNIFLNVSAGFQHIVSKTTFLTIEPTASYSLNNFNDSKSLLQANGYNLGVKMGVSFKVK